MGELQRDVSLPANRRAAVATLYQLHQRSLTSLAYLLVDDVETAEDIVQEAFVALYRHWGRMRDHTLALAYLRTTTVNMCRSRLRHRRVERSTTLPLLEAEAAADSQTLARAAAADLIDAIGALPRRQREVVVLRYFLDLSERDIAQSLGISTGSVKKHTNRALSALALRLEAWA